MELEFLATTSNDVGVYPYEIILLNVLAASPPFVIDTRPLIRAVVDDLQAKCAPAVIARRFHSTVIEIVIDVCRRLRSVTKLERVVLSGGVFMNALLTTEIMRQLTADSFRVFPQTNVPCNDGGLSFGQLAVAGASDTGH